MTEKEQKEDKGIALAVSETIENLQNLLKKRELELDEREHELELAGAALEAEHSTFNAKESDVLRLNIGGTMFDVSRRTLSSVEGSLLAMQFSGRWDDGLAKDSDGHIFLDHQPDLFRLLIDYLRDKVMDVPSAPRQLSPLIEDRRQKIRFRRLLEYYYMTLGVYPFSAYRLGDPLDVELMRGIYTGHTISNSTGTPETYRLAPGSESGHTLSIRSYSVALEKGTKAFVGFSHTPTSSNSKTVVDEHESGAGAGYAQGTIAIDVSRQGIAFRNKNDTSTTFLRFESAGLNDCPVIRCENQGKEWFVNGKAVASLSVVQGSGEVDIGGFVRPESALTDWEPVVTLYSGSIRFASIDLSLY